MNKILRSSLRAILSVGICLSSAYIFSGNWIIQFKNEYGHPVKVRCTETGNWWNNNKVNGEARGSSEFIIPANTTYAASEFTLPWGSQFIKIIVPILSNDPRDSDVNLFIERHISETSINTWGPYTRVVKRAVKIDKYLVKESKTNPGAEISREKIGTYTEWNREIGANNWEFKIIILNNSGEIEVRGLRDEVYAHY